MSIRLIEDNYLPNSVEGLKVAPLYDELCKCVLSKKEVIAWIIKHTLQDYSSFTIDELRRMYIYGDPYVDQIMREGQESDFLLKNNIKYDVRTRLKNPVVDQGDVLIDIEAQNENYPGYRIIKRAIYYIGTMIAEQKGIEFEKDDYNGLKRVVSIWICTQPAGYRRNSINRFSFVEEDLDGDSREYDQADACMGEIVMIHLGGGAEPGGLLYLLELLLYRVIPSREKIRILEEMYHMSINTEFEKEVVTMCNLSQGLIERGREQGRQDYLTDRIRSKIQKGNSIEEIADAMEESIETVSWIIKNLDK